MPSANLVLVCALSLSAAAAASAGTVNLSLQNGNGGGGLFNTTLFQIDNTSSDGSSLTGFTLTIGDTQYLFDQLYLSEEAFPGGNGAQTATLVIGDRSDDNAGPDLFEYAFTNFGAGVSFRGQWDIDNDNGDFNADARTVLFNNGALPNAVATFTFSDGSSLAYTFPDLPVQDSYAITIPGPGTLAMVGVLGLASARRRRA